MIKFENIEVVGFNPAIRGMRNPLNSWAKSDSGYCADQSCNSCPISKDCLDPASTNNLPCNPYIVGPADHDLMMRLAQGGPVHAKYRRMLVVYMDIIAPLYWWKEFDTYKVGTVANSCSTMHTIANKEFDLTDFSHDHLMDNNLTRDCEVRDNVVVLYNNTPMDVLRLTINTLNYYRGLYLETPKTDPMRKKRFWWQMIQLLPSSYNQRRTVMFSYEMLTDAYNTGRKDHKLDEWREFCRMIETLPYSDIITGDLKGEQK